MRSWRISKVALAAIVMLSAAASVKAAPLVFGNFESSSSDGFGSWNSGVVPFASNPYGMTFGYTSYGATNGSSALEETGPGQYAQTLAYDFGANGLISSFLSGDVLSFDFSARSAAYLNATGGIEKIENVIINAPGWGFSAIPSTDYTFGYFPGFNGGTHSFSINYDAVKAAMPANPAYIQMIITTNSGFGTPNGDFVFDNFALTTIPEPASLSMLGLGLTGLLSRRRRR